ncbi:MAG: hypothetical protein FJX23_08755 [Alphaproteobacteria bacterium]|nr:hypothetical protein [Alphaproteobacteria bacterium]
MGNPLPLALDPSRSTTGAATARDRSREEQQYRIVSHALHCAGLLNVIIDAVMFEKLGEGESDLKRIRKALMLFGRQMRRRESH